MKIIKYRGSLKMPIKTLKNLWELKKNFNYNNIYNNEINITPEVFENFKKSMRSLILHQPSNIDLYKYFLNADLKYISKHLNTKTIKNNDPILICVVKNDLNKIIEMYNYHKNIGIKHFVFIDNGSTDGTREFLLKKNDVDLITSEVKYCTMAREAWINRILCSYGYDRWYLVVDSDEMYNYINSEEITIQEHINHLTKQKIKRELSFMLDMYSRDSLFTGTNNFVEECCYFDYNTYNIKKTDRAKMIYGGPRKRLIQPQLLTKYPLFLFEKGDIQSNSHITFPYEKNVNVECTSVLMHYKFIKDDFEKYKNIVKEGNYFNGSSDYKAYLDSYSKNNNITFYFSGSVKYTNSLILKKIPILVDISNK